MKKSEAKEENMGKCLRLVRELVKKFQTFSISQVPREENVEVDQLAKLATTSESLISKDVMVQYLETPSIAKNIEEVQVIEYKGTWADPIVRYIRDGEVPDDKVQARKLRIKAARYALMRDVLYRRSFTLPYLRCLVTAKAAQAMAEKPNSAQIYGNLESNTSSGPKTKAKLISLSSAPEGQYVLTIKLRQEAHIRARDVQSKHDAIS
ncbi:hypothetical protein Vadar_004370 [Vaccinium darrowii]|uniref:Uncharacterized protein n=1 Tax=Vaccinium darrowii TaxID=229202 RepID=A0ACB7Y678_9ERIC|nr:hypothetical protein Vadar_004370 [Vaccinium darrowii]